MILFAIDEGIVLIDTWWNVNCRTQLLQVFCYCVLIDTWWNVNFITSRQLMDVEQF